MSTPLRFGVYCDLQNIPGADHHQTTWDVMNLIENADQNGYEYYCLIEHHFFENFSISANPLALFSAAAQRTQNIRFRTVCHTLPLHNPMILAGEIAAADILTNGRIECGIGRGHGWLYKPASIPHRESPGRYKESMEILVKAWTEETFSYDGEFYSVKDVSVVPKPVQKPHPKIYMTGTGGSTFGIAGANGWGIFLGGIAPFEAFKPGRDIYLEACKKHGQEPDFGYSRVVHIADDMDTARREAADAVKRFFGLANEAMATLQDDATKQALIEGGYQFYTTPAMLELGKMSADDIIDSGLAFVGTAESVTRQLEDFHAEAGFNEFCIISAFGGLDTNLARRNQERFANEVRPGFE